MMMRRAMPVRMEIPMENTAQGTQQTKTVAQIIAEAKAQGVAVSDDPTAVNFAAHEAPPPVEVKAEQVIVTVETKPETAPVAPVVTEESTAPAATDLSHEEAAAHAEQAKVEQAAPVKAKGGPKGPRPKGIDGKPLPKMSAKKLAEYTAAVKAKDTVAAKKCLAYARWYQRWSKGKTESGAKNNPEALFAKETLKAAKKGAAKAKPGPKSTKPAPKVVAKGKKAAKPAVQYGQGGPAIKVSVEDLNPKELATFRAIASVPAEGIPAKSIDDIATNAFKDMPIDKARLAVRASLRRLMRGKLVARPSRGQFLPTTKGLTMLIDAAAATAKATPAAATH